MNTLNNNSVTHQYVGPYFVPHGWTIWDDQTAYQPLAVVSYNLGWYILKRPAPVGTPPTDQDYWAQVDNWQGQVATLQNDFNSFKSLSYQNYELAKSKKYVFVGDSWSASEYTSYTDILSNYFDIEIKRKSGAGFCTPGNTFLMLINNITNWNEITDIYFLGGTNDRSYPYENIVSGITETINYVKQQNPRCNIHIGYLGLINEGLNGIASYMEGSLLNNVDYIKGSENINYSYGLLDNTLHPSQTLQNFIANCLKNYLIYNSLTIGAHVSTSTATFNEGYTGTPPTITVTNVNGEKTIYLSTGTISSGFKIGENYIFIHHNPMFGNSSQFCMMVLAHIDFTDNTREQRYIQVYFSQQAIQFYLLYNTNKTISNIIFGSGIITVPSVLV